MAIGYVFLEGVTAPGGDRIAAIPCPVRCDSQEVLSCPWRHPRRGVTAPVMVAQLYR